MGALIGLYAFFRYPSVFGRAGAMSPSVWFGQGAILDYIAAARAPGGRVYLDVGRREGAATLRHARELARLLVHRGFRRDTRKKGGVSPAAERRTRRPVSLLRYLEDPGGGHQEAAWAHRLDGALDFLLD
jgi:predicted alpha/beta superfamily hydrolase